MRQKTTLVGRCARIPPVTMSPGITVATAVIFTGHPTLDQMPARPSLCCQSVKVGLGGNFIKPEIKRATLICWILCNSQELNLVLCNLQ